MPESPIQPAEATFNLTLEDAEFVVDELPQHDEFTKALRRWCESERERRDEASRRSQEAWERIEPAWNRMLWRVVTGEVSR